LQWTSHHYSSVAEDEKGVIEEHGLGMAIDVGSKVYCLPKRIPLVRAAVYRQRNDRPNDTAKPTLLAKRIRLTPYQFWMASKTTKFFEMAQE
jgi:hypothetical protein